MKKDKYSANQSAAHFYLSNIRNTEQGIRNKQLELDALRWKASGVGAIQYDKDKVQTTANNYLEMAVSDLIELEAEIEEDRASIEEAKGNAYAIVKRLSKPEERAMIEWYYLNCFPMNEIKEKMHMSERNAYYLRNDALESFGRFISKD